METLFLIVIAAIAAIGLLIAGVTALGELFMQAGDYALLTVGVVHRRTPEYEVITPYRPQDEPVPAYRNYFLGQALRDVRQLALLAPGEARSGATERCRESYRMNAGGPEPGFFGLVRGLSMVLGHVLGALLAAPLLAAVLLVHTALVLLVGGAALLVAGLLRAADQVPVWLRGLWRGVMCPHCFERVRHPAYGCPREDCRRRHGDVRPGRYGLLWHRCQCGQLLPTLRMLMVRSRRLQPFCTYTGCGKPLSREAGHARELALPLIGGRAAGKTQLMAAMTAALEGAATGGGRAFRPADEESAGRFAVAREVLAIGGRPVATRPELPRAMSFVLGRGPWRRLLHVFDTAGERFTRREETDALRYAARARAFVFVLDPLAVGGDWPAEVAALASPVHPERVFAPSVLAMRGMGAPLEHSRLAVAISKTDVLDAHGLLPDRRDEDAWARDWLCGELRLGNLVAAMDTHFREVRFFFTSAVLDGPGAAGGAPPPATGDAPPLQVHASIVPLTRWCLGE
ncbi:hypothetical protein LG634_04600 [Streptomyces bambusae]|uniref:TRAFAC clade GTPase domain-containing protein n=1 Tax=Streptomyces bambusae TaxID=1550616 RepID=UPI001CFC725B|nr:hypothetical protein [Streptomyces bambusae]MCB5164115.1 hypothetical protein [Streptomyces bambusae]